MPLRSVALGRHADASGPFLRAVRFVNAELPAPDFSHIHVLACPGSVASTALDFDR